MTYQQKTWLMAAFAVAIGLSLAAVIVGYTAGGSGRPEPSDRTSYCAFATHTNGTGLVALTRTSTAPTSGLRRVVGIYSESHTPRGVRVDAAALTRGIGRMLDQPVPRTPDAETVTAARRVDTWVAANCRRGPK